MRLTTMPVMVGTLTLVAALALAGCTSDAGSTSGTSASTGKPAGSTVAQAASLRGTITAGGSSAQGNAQAAWTAAFQAQAGGVTINYDKSQGSGGGVVNWLNGSYDFAGTDAGLTTAQQEQSQKMCGPGGALNLPVYLSGVAIVYHLPGVKLRLSSATIAKIFSKKITRWNDPAIAADNPGQRLPDEAITVVSRSDASGTTANFTNYLSQVQPKLWPYPVSTTWPVKGTSGQQGGSGVVTTVLAGTGTIGYADHSSIGNATAAAVQIGSRDDFVSYSAAGATHAFAAAAQPDPQTTGDLFTELDYTKITATDAYPIPLLSYDVVCTTFTNPTQAKLTRAYLSFVAGKTGQEVAAQNAGSAPLPAAVQRQIAHSLKSVR